MLNKVLNFSVLSFSLASTTKGKMGVITTMDRKVRRGWLTQTMVLTP